MKRFWAHVRFLASCFFVLFLAAFTANASAGTAQVVTKFPTIPDYGAQAAGEMGDLVYIGGTFSTIQYREGDPIAQKNIAIVNRSTGNLASNQYSVSGGSSEVLSFTPTDRGMIVSGRFSKLDDRSHVGIALFSKAGKPVHSWDPSLTRKVREDGVDRISVWGDRVYMVGGFTKVRGQGRAGSAAVTLDGARLTAWKLPELAFHFSDGFDDACTCNIQIAAAGGWVYVWGQFDSTRDNHKARFKGLARVSATTGRLDESWRPALAWPRDLVTSGRRVYAVNNKRGIAYSAQSGKPVNWQSSQMPGMSLIDFASMRSSHGRVVVCSMGKGSNTSGGTRSKCMVWSGSNGRVLGAFTVDSSEMSPSYAAASPGEDYVYVYRESSVGGDVPTAIEGIASPGFAVVRL